MSRHALISLKMANEEEVLVDLSENVIEDKSTPKRKGNKVRTKKWNDEETDILIDMFEESACLQFLTDIVETSFLAPSPYPAPSLPSLSSSNNSTSIAAATHRLSLPC